MFLFETHLHTNACSLCGVSTAYEMVDAAQQKGYSGFVVTNHFFHGNTALDRSLDWKEFAGAYRDDYLKAKEYGLEKGITVLFGIEEVYSPGKEVLIYGIEPELIIEHPEILEMDIYAIAEFVHANNGIIAAAHPFRDRVYIPNPDEPPVAGVFDAIEVYNCGNQAEENEKALNYAKEHGLPAISGGDVHNAANFGRAGVAFYENITDNAGFVKALMSGNYKLIIEGELKPADYNND